MSHHIYRLRFMLLLGRGRVIRRSCTFQEHVEDMTHGIRVREFTVVRGKLSKAGPGAALGDARGVCDDGK